MKLKKPIKTILLTLKHNINGHPKLKATIMSILNHFPALRCRLKKIGHNNYDEIQIWITCTDTQTQLSPKAKKIYDDLKEAIQFQQEKH